MQNDRTASIAGKYIKTHQLEMRQNRKKAQDKLEQAEEMRKNEEATVAMLANCSDDQLSSLSSGPKRCIICTKRCR